MSEKDLKRYSNEELLRLLENKEPIKDNSQPKDELDEDTNEIVRFIEEYNLQPGHHKVLEHSLLYLFKTWIQDPHYPPEKFKRIFSLFFKKTKSKKQIYYRLNLKSTRLMLPSIKKKPKLTRKRIRPAKMLIDKFCKEHNISAGNLYLEGDILYYYFNNFLDKHPTKFRVSYVRFIKLLQLVVPCVNTSIRNSWFLVDPSIKEKISEETVLNWRKGREKYGKYKIKKTNRINEEKILFEEKQKSECEIPIIESEIQPKDENRSN